jgi:UDP-glucose 4-epimerase
MKALVTGGAGFIGSHLSDLLIKNGHEVIVIDNLSNGRFNNIEHHVDNKDFKFYELDITDLESIKPIFIDIDWVFHMAGMADIVPSIENPSKYYECNVTGTFNVLEASREAGVKKIVYAASSSSYGIPDNYPTPETADIRPQYPYALTKYMGEELVMHWSNTFKIEAISLRLFNVYGPRSRTTGAYGAVFGVFLSQKINNKPFTIVGDGTQTRDFTHVLDVANAFLKAAKSPATGVQLNVGSGNHYSVNYLVELLGGNYTTIPKRPGEPDCTFADISKIKETLNWESLISFEDGVSGMLAILDDWKDAPVWDPDSIKKATALWFEHLG